jgi:hypothetical protein
MRSPIATASSSRSSSVISASGMSNSTTITAANVPQGRCASISGPLQGTGLRGEGQESR